ELATLIGVEAVRLAVLRERLVQSLKAKRNVHGDRHAMGQDPARSPIHHSTQVQEPPLHRDVSDVHRPDLVGTVDVQTSKQVRVDLVPRMPLLVLGFLYSAVTSIRFISVTTCLRPTWRPCRSSMSRS